MKTPSLETDRLLLRQWQDSDLQTWSEMNADAEVMRYFERTLSVQESLSMAERIREHISETGWGLWALEVKEHSKFAGFVGLSKKDFGLPFMPCVEIGWRLHKAFWGQGLATEAAKLVLEFGLREFRSVYSYTSVVNQPSQNVMKKIGLVEQPHLAFKHPLVNTEELKPHVVFMAVA